MLTAEAKQAGSASDATRLTPRPPSLISRDAWSHFVTDKSHWLSAERSKSSKVINAALSTDGEQRSKCCARGALKEARCSQNNTRRASTNLHKLNERCQFKLYIGYWTSNNNKWPKCSCQTPPDNTCANDVIDNGYRL